MRFFIFLGIQEAVSSFANLESTKLIDNQRSVKSATELEIMECVNLATKQSILEVSKKIKLGTSADKIKQMLVESQSLVTLIFIFLFYFFIFYYFIILLFYFLFFFCFLIYFIFLTSAV